ncbi:MAG: ABC transporter permease [Micavibrio aeruginosavorus]|uniref:ABC transporter permease n=1 Tax=Micavibrio aeruginosavorus TaxID=349221 RepID=A0A2W5FMR9_9BACT|nr:MAG: ABC transporter permease [Micavibrio aeruginosavorus]
MNPLKIAYAALISRPFHSFLNASAVAAGVALLVTIFLLSDAIQQSISRNSQGVDIVVGAKGSPVQLVLSTIYHSDIPGGNIEMKDFQRLQKNPQIKEAIPVAIGDNYKGWRIVGTTPAYLDNFGAKFSQGRSFAKPFEAVAGAATDLKIGDEFAAMHGFTADGDDKHDFHLYRIVGVLQPTGMVLDRLITTSFESVQELHSHHHHDDHDAAEEAALGHEITAVLLKVKNPVAVLNLPREINQSTNMMAVSPRFQMVKLSQSLGVGKNALIGIGYGVMGLSFLMLLSTLMASLSARKYDLAILRVMGASRFILSSIIIAESLMLTIAGSAIGILAGHLISAVIGFSVSGFENITMPLHLLFPSIIDIKIIMLAVAAGLIASVAPAILARRTDIASILSTGKY